MKKGIPFFLLFILYFYPALCNSAIDDVKIRILTHQQSVQFAFEETAVIKNSKNGSSIGFFYPFNTYIISAASEALQVDQIDGESVVFLFKALPEIEIASYGTGTIAVNKKKYRGIMQVSITDANKPPLEIINVVSLEDYLRGTIKCEISHQWPQEAIRAHIVSARTYALNQMKSRIGKDFDMESGMLSQVYGGCDGEDTLTDEMVLETKGEYLSYKGELAQVFYHSCCGGYTEDAFDVWGFTIPYLVGVRCPFCRGSSKYSWERKYKISKIENAISKAGIDLGKLTYVWVNKKSRTGRVLSFGLKGSSGERYVTGEELRRIMGYSELPSTLFTVYQRTNDEFVFIGRGYGHGVGMCQWGSRGMAILGYKYKEILNFYYPGTKIKVIEYSDSQKMQ